MVKQTYGECLLDTGGYIFNTEAHPIDPDALKCCYDRPREQLLPANFAPDDYLGEAMQLQQRIYDDVKRPHVDDDRLAAENVSIVTDETGQPIVQLDTTSGHKTTVNVDENDDSASGEKVGNTSDSNDVHVITEINKIVSEKFTNISQVLESGLDAVGEWLKSENARTELLKIIGKLETTTEPNVVTESADEIAANENVSASPTQTNQPGKKITSTNGNANASSNKSVRQPTEPRMDWIAAVRPEQIFHEVVNEEPAQQQHGQFDVQRLIEKVRRMSNGTHTVRDYESLSCRTQTYLQRLAVHGEILT